MSKHLGDYDPTAVIYGKFSTYQPSTGATFTLSGSPAIAVYKDASTTQSTSGVTLTPDFDSVTGLNHFAVDTSSDGTFYSAGSFFGNSAERGRGRFCRDQRSRSHVHARATALKPATVDVARGRRFRPADATTVKLGPSGSGTAQTARDIGTSVFVFSTGTGRLAQQRRADANTVKLNNTSQTARDIGASVLLSSGTGTGQVSLSSGAIKTQTNTKTNTALNNFEFVMVDSSGVPATGLTVTATRSIDGGAVSSCANSVNEVSNGIYKIDLATTDLNGAVITLRFTASGAQDRLITVITTP
jgi:hypothetical protein